MRGTSRLVAAVLGLAPALGSWSTHGWAEDVAPVSALESELLAECEGEACEDPLPPESSTNRVALSAGQSVVDIDILAGRMVSVGVFGPPDALLGFTVLGDPLARAVRTNGSLDEDGRLPRIASLPVSEVPTSIRVVVDLSEPADLAWTSVEPVEADAPRKKWLRTGVTAARPLVGLPAPRGRADGYMLQAPSRYHFIRVDVAAVIMAALRKTERRFRAGPIAVADISQWNGDRPATDQGLPRHISHVGGRDVDLALPANDGIPSTIRDHCRGVLVEEDAYGCAPGTVRGLDAMRLAHLLGAIVDLAPPGDVVKVYLDDAYIREVRRMVPELVARRWIGEEGEAALSEEGILVASPWHTDHLHVRFSGEPGRPGF